MFVQIARDRNSGPNWLSEYSVPHSFTVFTYSVTMFIILSKKENKILLKKKKVLRVREMAPWLKVCTALELCSITQVRQLTTALTPVN